MREKEKMLKGLIYDAIYDEELIADRAKCKSLCFCYNNISPDKVEEKEELLKQILGKTGKKLVIEQPFQCDYGYNISVGENFFANYNMVILDPAAVTFGDNVFVGPNCSFCTPEHPLDFERRNKGLEYAYPINIGNNVWLGSNVVVIGGVTIGDNSVIGAGSVVTKDIPANVVAVGNPCRVLKKIENNEPV